MWLFKWLPKNHGPMQTTRIRQFIAFVLSLLGLLAAPASLFAAGDFASWLADLRAEALERGIAETTLYAAFAELKPIPRVIELDRKQPEFTQTLWRYLDSRVSEHRIERGRRLLRKHAALLKTIEQRYGVQPRFLVAFWGLETNFGDYSGGFSVIGALATLAYDQRRSDFFRTELLVALQILDDGHITANAMRGSWAGAMGQPQFMPSTFLRFAVDEDGDGRRDIWNSLPDVFASAANFLSKSGWRKDKTWGREIHLPKDFDLDLVNLGIEKPLAAWQAMGVRRIDGGDLPKVDILASIVLPSGYSGPAFLVYQNYRTILQWNRSLLYAIAVGHLADRLVGKGPLFTARPASETPLSRTETEEIQRLLADRGFDPGPTDGIIGSKTRLAIKEFQRMIGLPADGYPTPALLERLRATQ